MKFKKIIQVFPQVLKTHSEKFELEDLQDLDQVLAALDTQTEGELVNLLKNWFQNHTKVTETIRKFAQTTQELKKSPEPPPNSEASILQNLFELRETNQETIKAKTNQDKSKQSKQG
ncbi:MULTISPECIES: hypothetical protein [Moorena]|uniref:Uncharacterized protein n=1 Tax=Moorena producens 3L TaxID=489825 RepID=F4XMM8_9CYAN|nr:MULTISPECIES: hypothetical protein [Moorena]EGJ33937.1 hypothetical protein LYNGBM3L_20320 [Moorena producens 3L]NEP70084.1 hypothetical protein [Moorena sp. SIO3A5]OLT64937.1 hypothetical protein BI334_07755 [Moorena producens 3L]